MVSDRAANRLAVAGLVVAVLLATWPFLTVWHGESPFAGGPAGGNYSHYQVLYTARRTILEFGQFPFVSPWHGGYPTVGFAYDSSLSPRLVWALIFGEVPAVKVDYLVTYILAAVGMYFFSRRALGFGALGSAAAAAAYALSGYLPDLMLQGYPGRIRVSLTPLILALLVDRRRPLASLLGAAFVFYMVVADGGLATFTTAAGLVLAAVLQLYRPPADVTAFDRRHVPRLGGMFLWAAALALPKLTMMHWAIGPYREREPEPFSWVSVGFWLVGLVWLWSVGASAWARSRLGGRRHWWTVGTVFGAAGLGAAATLLSPTSADTRAIPPVRRLANQWLMMTEFRRLADFDVHAPPRDVDRKLRRPPGASAAQPTASAPAAVGQTAATPPEPVPFGAGGQWRTFVFFDIAVGHVGLALALLGAIARWRRLGRWIIALFFALVFQIGNDLPFDLVPLSHSLPVLREWDADISPEFMQPVVLLAVAVLAGGGVDWVSERFRGGLRKLATRSGRAGTILAAGLALLLTAWLIPQHWRGILEAFQYRTPDEQREPDLYTIRLAHRVTEEGVTHLRDEPPDLPWPYRWARRNVAAWPWNLRIKDPYWDAFTVRFITTNDRPGPEEPDYRGEIRVEGEPSDRVAYVPGGHTPNRLVVEADLHGVHRPAFIVFNKRYDPYWRSSAGEVIRYEDLLAVRLMGAHTFTREAPLVLRYRPSRFYIALAMSIGSLVAVPLAWNIGRHVRRR